MYRPAFAIIPSMIAILGLAVPVVAAGPAVTADVDGHEIAIDAIPSYFCHDLDYPEIHCFAAADDLQAALAEGTNDRSMAPAASNYVVVFSQLSYGGSYLYISQDYDTLAVVGWNDRVRSFRALNGEAGRFWTDWFHSGALLDLCCNSNVPSLSATFDQRITSVYRR